MMKQTRKESEETEPKSAKKKRENTAQRNVTVVMLAILLAAAVFLMRGHIQTALTAHTLVTQPNAQLMQAAVQKPETKAAKAETSDANANKAESKKNTNKKDTYQGLPWNLIVVNRQQTLPRSFTVDLEKVDDHWVDTRIAGSVREMLQAAKDGKVDLIICSAYRSVSKQSALYKEEITNNEEQGYDLKTSTALADQYMQAPGASEHHTGLALDVVTSTYQSLDSGFANTVAFQWLKENAPKYGFVIRYPENKQKITGILYEPWHFRYVGAEAAKEMTQKGQCLEEYVQTLEKENSDK